MPSSVLRPAKIAGSRPKSEKRSGDARASRVEKPNRPAPAIYKPTEHRAPGKLYRWVGRMKSVAFGDECFDCGQKYFSGGSASNAACAPAGEG